MGRDDHAGVPVTVEVLLMGERGGRLAYRGVRAPLGSGEHPDALATTLAELSTADLAVLHSTSWRFAGGGVTLTYVAVHDGGDDPAAAALPDHSIAHSGDPTVPSPPHVCDDAVATHAARHLAWLRERDEVAATALAALPDLWHALDRYTPSPAGQPLELVSNLVGD
jgi:hypothetical protein